MATTINKPTATSAPITDVEPVNGPQVSTQTVYVEANSVFGNVPVTTLEQITDLARNRFASEIVAVGQVTDSQMSAFRLSVLRDLIKQQHKQLVTRVADKMERKAREFYKELRARGIDREQAIKMSGYNPEL